MRYSITVNTWVDIKIGNALKGFLATVPQDTIKNSFSDSLHITVKGIATLEHEISSAEANEYVTSIKEAIEGQNAFKVSVRGINEFPGLVYAQIHSSELQRLHINLCALLPSSQPEYDREKYVPHISLFAATREMMGTLAEHTDDDFGDIVVDELQLLQWDADKPQHPKNLASFKFTT